MGFLEFLPHRDYVFVERLSLIIQRVPRSRVFLRSSYGADPWIMFFL